MPAHKGKLILDAGTDITELGFNDNQLEPESVLLYEQERAALFFGAGQTHFLTGGSTMGIYAMLACLPSGSKVLVQRDCHKSVIAAAAFFRLDPVFFEPEYDLILGRYTVADASEVSKRQLEENASAILVTHPNYYGECADIEAIAKAAGKALLLVDEAHGAHFCCSELLPKSCKNHAHMWVQSAHKTLAAPNQAAYLHISRKCPGENAHRSVRALRLLQTTSPSYPLLAALSSCYGDLAYNETISRVKYIYRSLGAGLNACAHGKSVAARDMTRIVVDVSKRGITGFKAEALLRKNGVYMEMADDRSVVGIAAIADEFKWYEMLRAALFELPFGRGKPGNGLRLGAVNLAMPPAEAMEKSFEKVSLCECEGRVSAGIVGIYPPGSALLMPGMVVEKGFAERIKALDKGTSVYGLSANKVAVVVE